MSFIKHLEKRVAERRAELAGSEPKRPSPSESQTLVEPEIAAMVVEFLCVIAAGLFLLIAKPEFSTALMVGAVYLKLRR